MKSLAKINLTGILKAHFDTLVDGSTKERKALVGERLVFFFGPAVVGALGAYLIIPTDKNLLSVLVTSLSIFAGLLFNLLVLVMQIIEKKKGNHEFIRLQKETYANIAYAIFVSLITSGILLLPYFVDPAPAEAGKPPEITIWGRVFWGIIYFLLLNFALTMAMILKRMHSILVRIMDYSS